jgi:hypothetical protein
VLDLYRIAHSESSVDKWDNSAPGAALNGTRRFPTSAPSAARVLINLLFAVAIRAGLFL